VWSLLSYRFESSAIGNSRSGTGGIMMRPRTTNEVKGMFHEAKGTIEEKVGELTNNSRLEARGKAEKLAGKIQTKVSQVGKTIGKF
jgi:uncharacterized protein YjbJ (UPF0337 family)